jgi:phosphorylcholine metabolism protein LicD
MTTTTYTNDIYGVQQQIADEQAAQEQGYITDAVNLASVQGAGMMLNARDIGTRQGDVYANLGRMLTGEEEVVDPRLVRMQKLQAIMEQVPEPDTVDEYIQLANLMNQAGLYGEAAEAMKMANEIRSSMPEITDTKTDKTRQFEYMQALDPELQQQYQDFVNPSAVPNTWAEYVRTDDTPTGEEFLKFIGSGNVEQTTEWKNYVNTTQNPTKEGFKVWIDRNQSIQKFADAKTARISLLMNDAEFLIKSEEEQATILNSIESEYADIQTFTQRGVVYNADTQEAMIPGSTEVIPTTIVGGRIYDSRTMELINKEGVERKMVKRDDQKWYYTDNGAKVFENDLDISDPEAKAAELFKQHEGAVDNEEERIALAKKLVQEGLAGTDVFSDLTSLISEDGTRAIEAENLVVKSIERLGENYVKSGVGTMDTILSPIEAEISRYMTKEIVNGEVVWKGSLPGWATVNKYQKYLRGQKGYEAREFAEKATSLINNILKTRSGAAVTEPEWERLVAEYATGWTTSAGFAGWVERIRDYTEKTRENVLGGYQPIVVNRYMANQGSYVTLDDPDNQLHTIPLGGYWRSAEDGQIYQKLQ